MRATPVPATDLVPLWSALVPDVAPAAGVAFMALWSGPVPGPVYAMPQLVFVATLSLVMGRTTILQGGLHLVIFAAFLMLAAMP